MKAVFVNIFGGIMKCDTIAAAIIAAYKEIGFRVPLVVRLGGNDSSSAGRCDKSGLQIITANGLTDEPERWWRRPKGERGKRGSPSVGPNPEKKLRIETKRLGPVCLASLIHRMLDNHPHEYSRQQEHAADLPGNHRQGGRVHSEQCKAYGTNLVGGVTPGRGGETALGVPVFDTCTEAVKATGANATMIFVPAGGAADAIMEAADAGIAVIVAITEGTPVLDMARAVAYLKAHHPTARLDRPELPWRDHPGRVQDRHHARLHPQAGPRRRGQPVGHLHL